MVQATCNKNHPNKVFLEKQKKLEKIKKHTFELLNGASYLFCKKYWIFDISSFAFSCCVRYSHF